MKKTLVADQWTKFALTVLPKGASATQIRETKRAFYAAAKLIFTSLAPGKEATADDLKVMDDINDEFNAFAEAIKRGQA